MFALKLAGVLVLTAFLYWAAWVWPALSFGFGSAVFGAIGLFLPFASLSALVGIVVGLVAVIKKRHRARGARLFGLSIAVAAGTAVGMWLGPIHKIERIRQVATSDMPLVPAIHAFERDQGRPPENLTELVPRYIPAIPFTGMPAARYSARCFWSQRIRLHDGLLGSRGRRHRLARGRRSKPGVPCLGTQCSGGCWSSAVSCGSQRKHGGACRFGFHGRLVYRIVYRLHAIHVCP